MAYQQRTRIDRSFDPTGCLEFTDRGRPYHYDSSEAHRSRLRQLAYFDFPGACKIYEYSLCGRIDLKLTCRHSKLLLWGTYIMDVLLVSLGGLGRPLAINLVIDKNRLTICMKVTPPSSCCLTKLQHFT